MTEWNIKGSRVYTNGEGKSYNCTNKVTAQSPHHTLTTYENTITTLQKQIKHSNNYKELQKQVIALQMDISNCQQDLNRIKELLQ
jgi:hypothetical protein